MIWGPVGGMLSLLPQFEGILWVLLLAFFLAAGGLALLFGLSPLRAVRWIPPGLCLGLLAVSQWIWRVSDSGGQGEGARAGAVMLTFIALPALLGVAAAALLRLARRRKGDTQWTGGRAGKGPGT